MDSNATDLWNSAVSYYQEAKKAVIDWVNSLNLNSAKIIELLSFFAIGFFSGFLLKKYFRYVLLSVILLLVVAFILENSAIIHIDWNKIRESLGVTQSDTIDSIFYVCVDWIKANLLLTIIGLIGFFIGYKVG